MTINHYRQVIDGQALATTADAVLRNYAAAGCLIVRKSTVREAAAAPAEHLIVVVFGRPDFAEAAFSRFMLRDKMGAAVIYSHRIYGGKAGEEMATYRPVT